MYDEENKSEHSDPDRLRDLEMERVLYWTRRLSLRPDEVQQLTPQELQCRLLLVEQAEQAQELRLERFKRWQNLCELRWLMYEVQREFNEKHGKDAIGVSIWRILAMEQDKLEEELQLDDLRGDCQRFPSPMSVMVPECETEEILKPLKSVLTGFSNNLKIKPSNQFRENKLKTLTPFTDALYEREKQRLLEESTDNDEELEEQVENVELLHCVCPESSVSELSSERSLYDLQEDFDIHLELQKIKESTARCDWIMDTLFAPYLEQSSQTSETKIVEELNAPFAYNLTMKTTSNLQLMPQRRNPTCDCQSSSISDY
ncbi:uncharacterized protein LOC117788297 [Drosophila innubila]|uniref:uncharacterized protein LOC117788297 n=1 Tax=Drosophila innubila TaxID=198719 RepID=UPI00148D3DC3|nr:uncharacterized protein LOC117788297 [Drosophila innubila]